MSALTTITQKPFPDREYRIERKSKSARFSSNPFLNDLANQTQGEGLEGG